MAANFFSRTVTKRIIAGGAAVGGTGVAVSQLSGPSLAHTAEEAKAQFETSWGYLNVVKLPDNWTGKVFRIKNDYPKLPGTFDIEAPWLDIDYKEDPLEYCARVKLYCWEGNVNNEFDVHKNPIRPWYHAPWMHWNDNGREPVHGLTFERPTKAGELSDKQKTVVQAWAVGFYNWIGAATFGEIWEDPAKPNWEKGVLFRPGTCVFKILMTEANETQLFNLKDAPTMQAFIATPKSVKNNNASERKTTPTDLRLLQVDFAVRDDRSPIGWVFGTFMYDGSLTQHKNTWDRIIPVGIMWGNDPDLTKQDYADGKRPVESWINPVADDLKKRLGGTRALSPWGVSGRLNGPVDNFKSACTSCHSIAENYPDGSVSMIPPDTGDAKPWFRNLLAPKQSFTPGKATGDYSLQLMTGYNNYLKWDGVQQGFKHKVKVSIPFSAARRREAAIDAKRAPLRSQE
ncbi:hypothetical protein B0T24DRAFT_571599 [Lasiosphaeria ovina]|uniref:Cytochrome c domain-containing protein n=1 Tax=Lasiosphaeria ovina TaxID=92902 RepID=A0AAE0NFS2_9PEZI|nr:hypothetical protein B0T24DRAFT_571599 [Lasiosphaeria ovina]